MPAWWCIFKSSSYIKQDDVHQFFSQYFKASFNHTYVWLQLKFQSGSPNPACCRVTWSIQILITPILHSDVTTQLLPWWLLYENGARAEFSVHQSQTRNNMLVLTLHLMIPLNWRRIGMAPFGNRRLGSALLSLVLAAYTIKSRDIN